MMGIDKINIIVAVAFIITSIIVNVWRHYKK